MRTANPTLNANTFVQFQGTAVRGETMTIQGTVNKTGLLFILLLLAAAHTWNMFFPSRDPATVMPWMWGGMNGGFVVALITVFKKHWAMLTSPLYAVLEGLFLGALSSIIEAQYPGIVVQAVGLTFGTFFALLLAYRSGLIRATENFKLGVAAATGGIFLVYMATMVLGFIGIGFSLFVVVIAAMNLVLDFDFIESGSAMGAPKYMEWYAAFGLLVTLIWLYIEILRLLVKLRGRR